jgi:glycogen debranching enzyme
VALRENFLRRFWWEDEGVFYLALNGAKEPCDVVSSNAGQCLWTGIVPQELAHRVVERLMHHDMYSGWGIPTLSQHAVRYNPMSYHNGSVWPHDTALVGVGFAHADRKAEAALLLKSLYEASLSFEDARLPELYCGFARRDEAGPTRYPVACSPQAWAAGAPFLLLSALLGLQSDAEHRRLIVDQPMIPEWLQVVDVPGICVGGKRLHLRFTHSGSATEVDVVEGDGVEVCVI